MAHIACPWDVHVLSFSRLAERRSQERRQPIVIPRRDDDMLRIAFTSGNRCMHGLRAKPSGADHAPNYIVETFGMSNVGRRRGSGTRFTPR